eukprot:TRINITY_DN1556_c0_g2_i1.p1 TRINITY_DN1556_c0_g2~~TRINITY_DN1556_c0_g2_i1.p1  ORF type:complete len:165 (-),score=32.14 TRINITY_DN1556_c0_g2_i1:2-496(-)
MTAVRLGSVERIGVFGPPTHTQHTNNTTLNSMSNSGGPPSFIEQPAPSTPHPLVALLAPFTSCFSTVAHSDAARRVGAALSPGYDWAAEQWAYYVRLVRGAAVAEPFLEDVDDNDFEEGTDSIQGSVFFPPEFPPTIPSDSSICLLYTSPSPRDMRRSRMPSSA